MKFAPHALCIAVLLLIGAGLANAQDTAPDVPAADQQDATPKPSEPASGTDTRSFTPSEEVSADAEVDFPADI
ncbi:MAG: hypothetical protein ACT4PG_09790 [Panacagrimonas sp.]